jgi:hypothetical protein
MERAMFGFLLWLVLLFLCWPLALLALILYPRVWLLLLPFRLLGIGVDAVFEPAARRRDAAGARARRAVAGKVSKPVPVR